MANIEADPYSVKGNQIVKRNRISRGKSNRSAKAEEQEPTGAADSSLPNSPRSSAPEDGSFSQLFANSSFEKDFIYPSESLTLSHINPSPPPHYRPHIAPQSQTLLLAKIPEFDICSSCSRTVSATWYALPNFLLNEFFLFCTDCISAVREQNQDQINMAARSGHRSAPTPQENSFTRFVETKAAGPTQEAGYTSTFSAQPWHMPLLAALDTSRTSSNKLCQSCHMVEVLHSDPNRELGFEYCNSCQLLDSMCPQPFPQSIAIPFVNIPEPLQPQGFRDGTDEPFPSRQEIESRAESFVQDQGMTVWVKECHLCKSRKSAKWIKVPEEQLEQVQDHDSAKRIQTTNHLAKQQTTSSVSTTFLYQKWTCWRCYQLDQYPHIILDSEPKSVDASASSTTKNSKKSTGIKTCQSCFKNSKKHPRLKWIQVDNPSNPGYFCSICSSSSSKSPPSLANSPAVESSESSSKFIAIPPDSRSCNICKIVVAKRWVKDKLSREGYLCNPCHNRRRNELLGRKCITCSATSTSSWVRVLDEDDAFYCKACSFKPGARIAMKKKRKKRGDGGGDAEEYGDEDSGMRAGGSEDGMSASGSLFSSFGTSSFNSSSKEVDDSLEDLQDE